MKQYNNRWRSKAALVALLATNLQAIQLNNAEKQHSAADTGIQDSDFNIMAVANNEPAKAPANSTAPAVQKEQPKTKPPAEKNNLLQALAAGTIDLDNISSEELQQIAMNAGLVSPPKDSKLVSKGGEPSERVLVAGKEAPPLPEEVKEAKKSSKMNADKALVATEPIQTSQVDSSASEVSQIESEIKEDEETVTKLKEKLTLAEQTLKDHQELLSKKKELGKKQQDKEQKHKELENSKEFVEKQDAVKQAMLEVQKAEKKVQSDKNTPEQKDPKEEKQMAQQQADMQSVVANALEAVEKSQAAQMEKLKGMLEAKEKAEAEKEKARLAQETQQKVAKEQLKQEKMKAKEEKKAAKKAQKEKDDAAAAAKQKEEEKKQQKLAKKAQKTQKQKALVDFEKDEEKELQKVQNLNQHVEAPKKNETNKAEKKVSAEAAPVSNKKEKSAKKAEKQTSIKNAVKNLTAKVTDLASKIGADSPNSLVQEKTKAKSSVKSSNTVDLYEEAAKIAMQFDGEGKEYLPPKNVSKNAPAAAPVSAQPTSSGPVSSNMFDKDDQMGSNQFQNFAQQPMAASQKVTSKGRQQQQEDPYSDIELNAASNIDIDREFASMAAEENDAFNTPLNSKEMVRMENEGKGLLSEITSGLKTYGKEKFWRKKNFFAQHNGF